MLLLTCLLALFAGFSIVSGDVNLALAVLALMSLMILAHIKHQAAQDRRYRGD